MVEGTEPGPVCPGTEAGGSADGWGTWGKGLDLLQVLRRVIGGVGTRCHDLICIFKRCLCREFLSCLSD